MFVAGPKGPKTDIVLRLVADVGFEPVDAGDLRAARLLESLGMLRLQLKETEGRSRDLASCWRPASGNSLNPYALAETPAATPERE